MNLKPNHDRFLMIVNELLLIGWSLDDIIGAAGFIARNTELAKEVSFSGAITLVHFILAREKATTPQVLGRCFHFQDEYHACRNDATVEAWGDLYCEECYERHERERPEHRRGRIPDPSNRKQLSCNWHVDPIALPGIDHQRQLDGNTDKQLK